MVSFFQRIKSGLKKSSDRLSTGISDIFTKKKLDSATLEELEELLLTSDMGISATTGIINKFSSQKLNKEATLEEIKQALSDEVCNILAPTEQKLELTPAKPQIILMVGVNGAGKTTTIGKLAHKFKGKQISLIAGDTFRAAAVEQLKIWGERNQIRVFSGPSGCDSAGLCFDGINEAIKHGDEIVFIDTAGRLQNKLNLTEELKKIVRVIKKVIPEAPHHTLLCIDARSGQNAVDQVKIFKEIAGVNGLIVNKLDGTAKGGILVAIAKDYPLPIYYIGVGEGIEDLVEFSAKEFSLSLVDLK